MPIGKTVHSLFAASLLIVTALAQSVWADGMILPAERHPERRMTDTFAVDNHTVSVSIDGQYAKTKVDQAIRNLADRIAQAQYFFPVPRGASISKFSMAIGEKDFAGDMLPAADARRIYEDYVRKMIDPALLEYVGQGLFKTSVFPFQPKETKKVTVAWEQVLVADNGMIHYVYPLNTEKFSALPLQQVKIEVTLVAPQPLKAVYSPTHNITMKRIDDRRAIITFTATNIKPTEDFHLYYTFAESEFGSRFLSYYPAEGQFGYFVYFFAPDTRAGQSNTVVPKDIVFVIDTSGSMQGQKMDQAKAALQFCLERLNAEDKFNVVDFSDTVRSFKDKLVANDKETRADSIIYAGKLNATGGTNIDGALTQAFSMFGDEKAEGRQRMVVFLTDGMPTVGQTDSVKIAANAKTANEKKGARLFNFGVGHDVNAILLDWLAEQNSGLTQYVDPGENLESAVASFYGKIKDPVLTQVAFAADAANIRVRELHPRPLPDVFAGTQLVIVGRYELQGSATPSAPGVAGKVTLTGKIKDKDFSRGDDVSFPVVKSDNANSWIEFLWASRQIGYLIDQIRLAPQGSAGNKELIIEVIRLSKRYGIPTEYTSYLVREDVNLRDSENIHRLGQEEFEKKDRAMGSGHNRGVGGSSYNQAKNSQAMRQSAQSNQGQSKAWKDDQGEEFQTEAIANVGRKTLYRRGAQWQDEAITADDLKAKMVEIVMYSDPFFDLLAKEPELNQIVSKGPVQVKWNGTIYNFTAPAPEKPQEQPK